MQCHVDGGESVGCVGAVEVDTAEGFLDNGGTGVGQPRITTIGVGFVVQPVPQSTDDVGALLVSCPRVHRPRHYQRYARFVDQHGVGFVDDGYLRFRLHQVVGGSRQPVAQYVEADFADGAVAYFGAVGLLSVRYRQCWCDPAHGHSQQFVHVLHSLGVTTDQVVVDGDDV